MNRGNAELFKFTYKTKSIHLLNTYNVWIKENDMEPKVYSVYSAVHVHVDLST